MWWLGADDIEQLLLTTASTFVAYQATTTSSSRCVAFYWITSVHSVCVCSFTAAPKIDTELLYSFILIANSDETWLRSCITSIPQMGKNVLLWWGLYDYAISLWRLRFAGHLQCPPIHILYLCNISAQISLCTRNRLVKGLPNSGFIEVTSGK